MAHGSGLVGRRKIDSCFKELQKFAVFIIRRFAEVAQKNRKSYMELLFWKTSRDATEIVDGYSAETSNKKVSRTAWTEAEEEELRTLFMEHQTNKYPKGKLFISSISHEKFVEFDRLAYHNAATHPERTALLHRVTCETKIHEKCNRSERD